VNRRAFLRRSAGVAVVAALPAWTRASAVAASDPAVHALASLLDGDVVTPASPAYATARQLWDTRFDSLRPRAIAYCANAADVQRTVRWGRAHGIRIVPRSGGHSYGGYSSGNGVVVADVSRLASIATSSGHAVVGAGAQLIDVYATLAAHGVTVPGGSCASVGIAGLALGGGVGYSSRQLGTTADAMRRVQIVTADGSLLTCDAAHNADLFWASRGGGGGSFGIAVDFTFRTSPVSTVSLYEIEWPWAQAAQAVSAWQAFAPHAPNQLFSVCDLIATAATGPPHVVSAGQFFGSEAALTALIQPLTSTGAPTRVKTQTLTYLNAALHWAGCRDAGSCTDRRLTFKAKSDYVRTPLPAAAVNALVAAIAARQGQGPGAIYLDAYGGAINAVPAAATAFVHRNELFSIQYTAQWQAGSSPAATQSAAWLQAVHAQLGPDVSGSAYQNYIDPQLAGWAQAYYGSNLPRLKTVKRRYDPTNAFRSAQSVPPR
jgi:FAD/FMN-containing dehydrogenase